MITTLRKKDKKVKNMSKKHYLNPLPLVIMTFGVLIGNKVAT